MAAIFWILLFPIERYKTPRPPLSETGAVFVNYTPLHSLKEWLNLSQRSTLIGAQLNR